MKLAYLLFDVRRPDRWAAFATGTLGLPPAVAGALHSLLEGNRRGFDLRV